MEKMKKTFSVWNREQNNIILTTSNIFIDEWIGLSGISGMQSDISVEIVRISALY